MSFICYTSGMLGLLNGSIDWVADGVFAALLDDGYVPSLAHDTWSDVSADEITDVDYAQKALTTKSTAVDGSGVLHDCDDINFGVPVTISARYIVLVKGTAGAAVGTDPLIGYQDFGTIVSSLAAQFAAKTTLGVIRYQPS